MHPAALFSGRKNVPLRNPFPVSGGNIPLFGLLSTGPPGEKIGYMNKTLPDDQEVVRARKQ
jgi:hypothetical protein